MMEIDSPHLYRTARLVGAVAEELDRAWWSLCRCGTDRYELEPLAHAIRDLQLSRAVLVRLALQMLGATCAHGIAPYQEGAIIPTRR